MKKTIAIDIGGTNTACGLVSEEGAILAKETIPTRGHDGLEGYMKAVHKTVRRLIEAAGGKDAIVGIGIGAPCSNPATGEIEAATDLPWPSPIPLKKIFEEEFRLPVYVANDAKAAAVGEMMYGAAQGLRNFIMLTLGTGVGAGIIVDGKLLGGSRGFAGELGHVTIVDGEGRECGCGRKDCLQNYCSAGGVVETARRLLKENSIPSTLRTLEENELTAKKIYESALYGDELGVRVFEETGRRLGKACANYAAMADPEAIVFFGGVANAFELMKPSIEKAFEENALFLYKGRVKFLKSKLKEADAALLGASALIPNT